MTSRAEDLTSKLTTLKSISTSRCHLHIDTTESAVEIRPVIDGEVYPYFIASYSLANDSIVDIPKHRLHLKYNTIYSSRFDKIVAYHAACNIHSQIKDKNTDLGKAAAGLCRKLHDWALDDEDKDEYLGQTRKTVTTVTIAAWVLHHLKLPYSNKGIYIDKGKYYTNARTIASEAIPYYVTVTHWSLGYRLLIKEWHKDSGDPETMFDDAPVVEVDEHLFDYKTLSSVSWMTDPKCKAALDEALKAKGEYEFEYFKDKLGDTLKYIKTELKFMSSIAYSDERCMSLAYSSVDKQLKSDIIEYMQDTRKMFSDRLKATEAMLKKFGLDKSKSSRSKKA